MDLERGRILDARFGGLLPGRKTADDDIPMFAPIGGGLFRLQGLMQGGEYILSRMASVRFGKQLVELNQDKGPVDHSPIAFPCRAVIDTNFLPQHGALWIMSGQFIVNRFATRKHIELLDQLNAEANEMFARDPELTEVGTSDRNTRL